jgi:DNA-binding Lrp family transcriptional regulator
MLFNPVFKGIEYMPDFVKAYFLANVKQGTEHTVAQKIRKMKEVTEVLVTYGLWNLVVRIEALAETLRVTMLNL